jgi:hypothetical protein
MKVSCLERNKLGTSNRISLGPSAEGANVSTSLVSASMLTLVGPEDGKLCWPKDGILLG